MALSNHEQRLLEEMEAQLAAEDPKLASTLRGTTVRQIHKRRAALSGVIFLLGMGCLVVGMRTHFLISILGFVLMLAAAVIAITSWRYVDSEGQPAAKTPRPSSGSGRADLGDFMNKMQERWEKRQREGL